MKFFAVFALLFVLICAAAAARQDCPLACPLNYQPTCGFNGRCYRTFGNQCDMDSTNCRGNEGNFRGAEMVECNKRNERIC